MELGNLIKAEINAKKNWVLFQTDKKVYINIQKLMQCMIILKHTHVAISELIIFEGKKKPSKFDIFENLSVHEFDNVAILRVSLMTYKKK